MRLNTFGHVHIARDDGEEVALQPLPLALLVHLAVSGPRDREYLADLFWQNNKNRLNSLSTTLNRIRSEVPDGVWVRGNTLVGTDLRSDVADLRDAIDRSDFARVAELYAAPFLGGLKLRGQNIEFEEWMLEQRATLAATVELALLQRARELSEVGQHQEAAIPAEQAWEIAIRDGFPSPDYYEVYHRILAAAARPSASAVRAMSEELGIELPLVEPIALEPSTEAGEPTARTVPSHPTGNVTPLFGCEDELNAIASSVASHRLTTVVGLGGGGKTRLAAEFFDSAAVADEFPDRYWVSLRDVIDEDLVAPAIASSVGKPFVSVAGLADSMDHDRPVLLVLDNFEHVLGSAAVVEELAQANESVRILVTSRGPLEVQSESLVHLNGLDTEDADNADLDSPAEQLLVSSARRAGVSEDRLGAASREALRDVCRRVGGNPLALEIAGGWLQILSPTEILDALAVDNELLGSPMADDLRSVDAVLHQSWARLEEPEQNTLMLLATFPGGCLTSEALKLQGLPIRSIGQLVQHSLVRLHVEGRLTLHPLIASHALLELEQRPELQSKFREVLSTWCQSFAERMTPNATSTHSHGLGAEIANFTAAWHWDAQGGRWELHRATLELLRRFFTESGRVSEARALFAVVNDAVQNDPTSPRELRAAVLEALGWVQVLAGELTQARSLLNEALSMSSADDPHAQARTLRSLGVLQLNTGEIDEATANFEAGLALVAEDPSALTASLQYDLAQAHQYRGDSDKAAEAARMALHAGRAANDGLIITTSYLLLADIEVESDPERAIVLLDEGWVTAKEAALDSLAIYFPALLGLAHLSRGELDLAESYFTDGIDAADRVGQLATVCGNYVGRAEARLLQGREADAIDDLKTGIRLAIKTGSGRYLMWAAVVSCRSTRADEAPSPLAKDLLLLTLRHSAADQAARAKAIDTLRELFDMVPDTAESPDDDHTEASLDEIAERSLQLLTLR